MDSRLAVIAIFISELSVSAQVNALLHEYSNAVVGRMGIPLNGRQISVISVIVDAPNDTISALSGKLGRIPGVQTKTIYMKEST